MSQMAMTISLTVIILMLLLAGILAQPPIQGSGHSRALRLLKQWLSPEQLACYERFAYFDVIGSHSGSVFRIRHGTQANIEELNNAGEAVCRWCFVPVGYLAAGDVMLAQKVALETNEPDALSIANRLMGPHTCPRGMY
jgi:hypothetical protein